MAFCNWISLSIRDLSPASPLIASTYKLKSLSSIMTRNSTIASIGSKDTTGSTGRKVEPSGKQSSADNTTPTAPGTVDDGTAATKEDRNSEATGQESLNTLAALSLHDSSVNTSAGDENKNPAALPLRPVSRQSSRSFEGFPADSLDTSVISATAAGGVDVGPNLKIALEVETGELGVAGNAGDTVVEAIGNSGYMLALDWHAGPLKNEYVATGNVVIFKKEDPGTSTGLQIRFFGKDAGKQDVLVWGTYRWNQVIVDTLSRKTITIEDNTTLDDIVTKGELDAMLNACPIKELGADHAKVFYKGYLSLMTRLMQHCGWNVQTST